MPSHVAKSLLALVLLATGQLLAPTYSPAQGYATTAFIELLTPPEGQDFGPFIRSVYVSIKRELFANMPESIKLGEKGIVSIQLRVGRDGRLAADLPKVVAASGHKELTETALTAVRKASPFNELPEEFSQPFVDLRMTFYYNVDPPKR
jgi:TonB family protein